MSVEVPNDMAISAKTTTSLNLRAGPGTSYAVITTMPGGATVTITSGQWNGEETNWYPVKWNGYSGWASGQYLRVSSVAGGVAKVTELQALDNLFQNYGLPYLWGRRDCSQFVVDRWRDWGYVPEDGFLDAESDRMFDNFRNGVWEGVKQDPANPARLSLAFYVNKDLASPNTAHHVQFVLWPGIGLGENGGNRETTTEAIAISRDARSKVSPVNYNPGTYVLGGIWLPNYRWKS